MEHTLTLAVPDEVYAPLAQRAVQVGKSPEAMALELLQLATRQLGDDPLLRLAGRFESPVTDVSEHHDGYVGENLVNGLRGSDGE